MLSRAPVVDDMASRDITALNLLVTVRTRVCLKVTCPVLVGEQSLFVINLHPVVMAPICFDPVRMI